MKPTIDHITRKFEDGAFSSNKRKIDCENKSLVNSEEVALPGFFTLQAKKRQEKPCAHLRRNRRFSGPFVRFRCSEPQEKTPLRHRSVMHRLNSTF
jgi:hypothetical protein